MAETPVTDGPEQPQGRPVGRRRVLRWLAIAVAAVVIAAGVGIGIWQAVEYFGQREEVSLIGDATDQTATSEVPFEFTVDGSASVSGLKLAEVWTMAAAACVVDPAGARLEGIQIEWEGDGQLSSLMLDAVTPDGRRISVTTSPGQAATEKDTRFQVSAGSYRGGDIVASGPAVAVGQALAALDSVGLMEIAGRTDLASGRTGWFLYDCYGTAPLFTEADAETLWQEQGPSPVFLAVTEGRIEHVEDPDLLSSLLPAQVFALGQSSRAATGELITAGEPYTMVLVRPLSAEQQGEARAVQSQPIDEQLNGIAFKVSDWVFRVRDGQLEMIEELEYGRPFSYSLGRQWLLCMALQSDASGSPEEVVSALPAATGQKPRELLRDEQHPSIIDVRYDENTDQVWFSKQLSAGSDDIKLWTATPHDATSIEVPLAGSFGGDFDVSLDGNMIVYAVPWPTPARIGLHTREEDTELPLGLAIAYDPVFSPDGGKICLVGSEDERGSPSLWLYDLETEEYQRIQSTDGLYPTHPAFSPDGMRIAFRGFWDGYLWTVDLEGGTLNRYTMPSEGTSPIAHQGTEIVVYQGIKINVGDAPIAW